MFYVSSVHAFAWRARKWRGLDLLEVSSCRFKRETTRRIATAVGLWHTR